MDLSLDPSLKARAARRERSTPPMAPLSMPTQSLDRAPARRFGTPGARVILARAIAVGGAAALTWYGNWQMMLVFGNETSTPLQLLLLVLFTITFGWIAFSATQAVAGLLARRPRDPEGADGPLSARTAIVMPVYNENPAAVTAALHAMGDGLASAGHGAQFEIFILSDTTDPAVLIRETAAYAWLRRSLSGKMRVWYRRRVGNVARKAGNLRDFVERWGARYDHMLVLDADSLMAPETIIRMVRRMEAAPRLGILQTLPATIGGDTVFARLQQFAARLYGPVVARGVAAWQGEDGNYWGHNALIRVRAFAENCGLPELPGRPPFGGHILSHDFVEAALMRRGGWQVRMDFDLDGSWEGAPPSLVEFAARDRRWAQGNLQHIKVIGARGLAPANRLHFGIGIGSYVMSSVWLAMLLTGALLTAQSLLFRPEYFSNQLQLFPDWPIFDAERMVFLFVLSAALLLLPKAIGVLRALVRSGLRRRLGGAPRILSGAVLEVLLSALFAPILMLMQVRQIWEITSGRDSGWSAQRRNGALLSWRQAFGYHKWHVVTGMLSAGLLLQLAPDLLAWTSPVLAGLIVAPAVSRMSGDRRLGRALGVLGVPEDRSPPEVVRSAAAAERIVERVAGIGIVDLTDDPVLRADHLSTLPEAAPEAARERDRLAAITARAKIEAAADPIQAISWMTREETLALLSSAELLALFGTRFRRAAARPMPDMVAAE
jgi:membrane glycosyltransferase